MKTPHVPISSQRKKTSPVSSATSAFPGTSADSDRLDCHNRPAKKRRVFDFNDLCHTEDDHQQSCNELALYINPNVNGSGSGRKVE